MISSELLLKKNSNLVSNFFNLFNTFLTKHGKNYFNLFVISNFLFLLKNTNEAGPNKMLSTSPYLKFYNFISKLTPRISIVSVENKKAGKIFKIPMPPSKNSLLQHNFLIKYLAVLKNKQKYRSLPHLLFQNYQETLVKRRGLFMKEWDETYGILKQHKFRAKKRHDKLIKRKKNFRNVITKSKQFYI